MTSASLSFCYHDSMPARTPASVKRLPDETAPPPVLSSRRAELNLHRREATEARILGVAVDVFNEKGYAGATVSDIVERSGLSRGAFYLYYQNKNEIFKALVHEAVRDLYNIAPASAALGLRERIRESTRLHFLQFTKHRGVLRCLFEVSTVEPELGALHNQYRAEFVRRIEHHLRKAQKAGQCTKFDTRVASYCLGCMIGGVAYMWLCADFEPWEQKQRLDPIVDQVTDFWCRTLYTDV